MNKVALIGGRGFTGAAFLNLLARHPQLELAVATSGSQAGQPIADVADAWRGRSETFATLTPEQVPAVTAGVWVLALPNGASAPWVAAIDHAHPEALIVDLGADYRFDPHWVYGLPELGRDAVRGARRIANPGCYATGAQLALAPLAVRLAEAPVIFGVSGYSGAGRTPGPRNDPERLADNLVPYALAGHVHEQEISHRLGADVRFHPHVAAFFRGISLTVSVTLDQVVDADTVRAWFERAYGGEPRVMVQDAIPEVRAVVNTPDACIGGITVDPRDGRRVTLVVVLDNLLKGAASQALQNINLALGLDEHTAVVGQVAVP